MKYLPNGTPVLDFTLAAPQRQFEKKSIGYFEIVVCGEAAENVNGTLKIGKNVSIQGGLWMRNYKNRQGNKITETKILVESIEGEWSHEKR